MADFAASKKCEHRPGESFLYSSGTSNILSEILTRKLCPSGNPRERKDAVASFIQMELFSPLGVGPSEAMPKFDETGNFIASSFVYATARAFAKIGQLLLNKGEQGNIAILPQDWVSLSDIKILQP